MPELEPQPVQPERLQTCNQHQTAGNLNQTHEQHSQVHAGTRSNVYTVARHWQCSCTHPAVGLPWPVPRSHHTSRSTTALHQLRLEVLPGHHASKTETPSPVPLSATCSDVPSHVTLAPSQQPHASNDDNTSNTGPPRRCYPTTKGPCITNEDVCLSLDPSGTCPHGSHRAPCPTCTSGTGPCRGESGECSEYEDKVHNRCKRGHVECYTDTPSMPEPRICSPCLSGTNGPCQIPYNLVCFGAYGTRECFAWTNVLLPALQAHPHHPCCTRTVIACRSLVHDLCCLRCRPCWCLTDFLPGYPVCPVGTLECTSYDDSAPIETPSMECPGPQELVPLWHQGSLSPGCQRCVLALLPWDLHVPRRHGRMRHQARPGEQQAGSGHQGCTCVHL